ncbi:MAG: carboxymuconolactone decarboxylase family protein [Planctomycetes bacterium]|nr:carboxymuconolactone decarboxylase family protein [Planctomycetota bacterium]
MPRLHAVDPDSATGKAKELFEGPLKRRRFNVYRGLANSPAALEGLLRLSESLQRGSLDPREREIVALVVGEANRCAYCLAGHSAAAEMAGLTPEECLAARRGRMEDAKFDALARFVTALHEKRGWISDEDLSQLRAAGYNDGHVVEIVACYAMNTFTNYFNHVNDTEVDLPAAPAAD